ncbi:MAG: tRNA dihydrouridine synthase DusB [Oscillospiraceae bacterium]|nr:tRNA dihydrouridine synthase DusB [Oscillospiraceae bacterium]
MNNLSFLCNRPILAPMAGVADSAFRATAMSLGAGCCTSEMISTKALCFENENTKKLLYHTEAERPFGIQLFGNLPSDFRIAAAKAYNIAAPDFIDINMGCPAPKIYKGGAGSALMKNKDMAMDIIGAVVSSVPVPVTAKIRSGIDDNNKNAVSFAKALESAGAAAITIHGRTTVQMYRPPVDYEIIRQVASALHIPVIANGDVQSFEDYSYMKRITGCDGVMIGRGALGNPYVFSEINSRQDGTPYIPPTLAQRLSTLRQQLEMSIEQKGEKLAIMEGRKHAAWYIKGLRQAATFRRKAFELESFEDLDRYIDLALQTFVE